MNGKICLKIYLKSIKWYNFKSLSEIKIFLRELFEIKKNYVAYNRPTALRIYGVGNDCNTAGIASDFNF